MGFNELRVFLRVVTPPGWCERKRASYSVALISGNSDSELDLKSSFWGQRRHHLLTLEQVGRERRLHGCARSTDFPGGNRKRWQWHHLQLPFFNLLLSGTFPPGSIWHFSLGTQSAESPNTEHCMNEYGGFWHSLHWSTHLSGDQGSLRSRWAAGKQWHSSQILLHFLGFSISLSHYKSVN